MIDLKGNPFYLNDEDIQWVEKTLAEMSEDEKVSQLFCQIAWDSEKEYLKNLTNKYKPGGLMFRTMPAAQVVENVRILQENSKIPLLIAANLEAGANGIVLEGTKIGSQMQVAATGDDTMACRLGTVCGREGSAVGVNWAFAPVIDIDYNFRNPITNTRTLGSDPERVKRMGVEYVKAVQKHGVAASIKHFPGDGLDERDQHLVTSINSMSCKEWDETYGATYKACIDAGAMTVMVGHIMQPAYTRKYNPGIKDEYMLPASLSYELTTKLLKEQLGFNGLIVTDASRMAGMVIAMPRNKAVPQAIAAGCDMFLFTFDMEEDYGYMKKGIEDGIITHERLNEALTKILATKAALKLHKKQASGTLIPTLEGAMEVLGIEEHKAWAEECADKSITLVKNKENLLPISPVKYKKVLLYGIESGTSAFNNTKAGVSEWFKERLEKEGFSVDIFEPKESLEGRSQPLGAIVGKYDLIIYIANLATKSNQTTVRLEWSQPMGNNVPVYITMVPTIFISLENPYHLQDVPRIRTFINTYSSSDTVLEALIEKLMGRSEFKGKSPVDAFCGMWDTKL